MKATTIKTLLLATAMSASAMTAVAADDAKLSGTPIGTERCWNYESNAMELNAAYKLFDGDLNTYYATEARSYTWGGLDLGTPHVITRVGWSPRNDSQGEKRVLLGVFEGANSPDFLDAVPIFIIPEKGTIGTMSYGDVDCSRGFRYVRYVSTNDARCNMAELEFYGHEGAGDDSHLFQLTNLPTVVLNTVNSEEPYDKEHDIVGNFIIINDHQVNVDYAGSIRERGNGSRAYAKKPWRIKFEKKQNVLDAPAKAKKWTLINNHGDRSLMRNIVSYEMARRIGMNYVTYCQPVDVFLNGEYKGLYNLCDQVEVNKNRVNITEMEKTDLSGEALTGGYLFEIDAYAGAETSWFQSTRGIPVTIKSPDDDDIQSAQSEYIKNYFQLLEDKIYSADYAKADGYRTVFNIESFLKHLIVNELAGNVDTYWSTYMYKDRGNDTIYTGPVWDMDLTFDIDDRIYPTTDGYSFLFNRSGSSAANGMKNLVRRVVLNDVQTKKALSRLWSLARNEQGFTAESLGEYIDETAQLIYQSQQYNFTRWPILSGSRTQIPSGAGTFESEVAYLKDYLEKRIPQLDNVAMMNYDSTISSINLVDADAASTANAVSIAGHCITPLNADEPYRVYSLQGIEVFSGTGTTPALTPGIYVVRLGGGNVLKVAITL